MARIRTVKPEFFRHEALQDLEAANLGKYPMLVFEGLWGHCDKAGRFEWRPRQLKLDILPFLNFDMAETLQILADGGMVERYEVNGKQYGVIRSFSEHQRLSGKEAQEPEKYPAPPENQTGSNGEATGKQLGSDWDGQESQEGKGIGKEGNGVNTPPEKPADSAPPEDFMSAWTAYPSRPGASRADSLKAWKARIKAGADPAAIIAGVRRYAEFCMATQTDPQFIKQPATFFGPGEHYLADWAIPKPRGSPTTNRADDRAKVGDVLTGRAAHERHCGNERDITGEAERIA